MNNEKLNIQYLIDSVSAQTGNTKKETEVYIKEFSRILKETLLREGLVKIKGLGTLKLQWNKSRKSVNVQTGEVIEISGHYKIDFTPENSLKDFANQPFAHLDNIMLDTSDALATEPNAAEEQEQINKLAEQALEIKSLLSDINDVQPVNPVPAQSEDNDSAEHTVSDEPVVEPVAIPTAKNDKEERYATEVASSSVNNSNLAETTTEETTNTESEDRPQKKKKRGWLWILILIALILIALGTYHYIQSNSISVPPTPASNIQIQDDGNAEQVTTEENEPIDETAEEEMTEMENSESYESEDNDDICQKYFSDFDINNCETLAEVEVTDGARLAWYSTKYYGSYQFWPYIYAANRDIMSSPNDLEKGTVIKIPKLPKEMIDANNDIAIQWCEECIDKQ